MRAEPSYARRAVAMMGLALLGLVPTTTIPAQRPAKPATKAGSATTLPNGRSIPIATAGFDQGRPAGLFYRLKVDLTSGTRLEVRTFLFMAGNRMTRTFPSGGGDVFDPSRCNPDMCGSYQFDADQIAVRWDNGQVDRWPYRRTAEGVDLDGSIFKPARPLTGAVLIGTWGGAATTGNPTENVYAFNPDGTFTIGAGRSSVGGRYSVRGLTLSLAFADGLHKRRTLFAAGTSEPIGLIAVDGDVYRRR